MVKVPARSGIATTRQNQSPPTEPTTLLSTVAPLTQAVLRRDVTRLQQLLEAGEDPDKRDEQGHSPWMWSIHFQENDALRLLLKNITSIRPAGGSELAMTGSLNNLVAARVLLSKGVPVDSPATDGATPLLVAASSGYTDLMKLFLAAGADPNAHDQHGDTPLMAAVRIGSITAVKLLLANRADPNTKDRAGRTALHWAGRSGRVDVVRALVEAGATIDVVDETGRTALAYAKQKGYAAVAEMLRTKGARDTADIVTRAALTPREAVKKSLPLLQRGWQSWNERQSCGACHHRLMQA